MPHKSLKVPKNENSTPATSSDVIDNLFKEHNRKKLKQEHKKKMQKKCQRKHDYFVALFSAAASAFLTNIDRIIKFIKELISL